MVRWPFQALLTGLILTSACSKEEALVVRGTVSHLPVGGFDCWLLTSDDRKPYVLLNVDENLAVEGLHVAITGRLRRGSTTPCQVGLPLEVASYRSLKDD